MDGEEKVMVTETKSEAIMPIMPQMIRPIVTVEKALEAWQEYQSLKTKLADKGDFANIQGKQHPTKQFANKLSKFFGLSVQIIKAEKEVFEDSFTWHIWARATAPNGQFRESDGHCSSKERKFAHLEHDVYATAVTRAKNRAILELAGFGEVTAEEITDDDGQEPNGHREYAKIELKIWDDKTRDFTRIRPCTLKEAIEYFGEIKKRVGDEVYYETLGQFGYEHANQVKPNEMPAIFKVMTTVIKERQIIAKK